jgi:uncharacterized protein
MDWISPLLTVLVGYVVLGITGFGSALIVVPLLAWKWPLPEVVALMLMMDAPAAALFGGLNFKQVSWPEVRRLVPSMAVGSLAGLWLIGALEPKWPLLMLGLYVAAAGINALRAPGTQAPSTWPTPGAHAAGFLAGIIEMMFGTAGPVLMAWLQHRLPNVRDLRATMPVTMLMAVCAVLVVMGFAGRLSSGDLWQRYAVLLPAALLGVTFGHRLSPHVPAATLRRAIFVLLILSGLTLVGRALR